MSGSTAVVMEKNGGEASVPRFELAEWRSTYGVVAGITGRAGAFDLGLTSPDPMRIVMDRWTTFLECHNSGFSGVVVSFQPHGSAVGVHRSRWQGVTVASGLDGHATDVPGVLIGVTVADCIPVYLLHPGTGAVAVLHAGWRGIVAGILEHGIETLCDLASATVDELLMHCGVGICGACYEVGPEVYQEVTGCGASASGPLDLRTILSDRALARGLTQVTTSAWCSAHDEDRFYSHRASGGVAGRMLAYIGHPLT